MRTPEVISEFFYIRRNEDIGFEEFKDSCDSILDEKHDLEKIFQEISEKRSRITKEDFISTLANHFQVLENNKSSDILVTLRIKLKKKYKSFMSAFNELASSSNKLQTDAVLQSLSLKNNAFSSSLPNFFTRYQFKKLWYNKEEICRVDSCIERSQEYDYCDQHFKGLLLRGEEALGKISASVPQDKCISLLTSLLMSLKNRTPFSVSGIQKRDVQALQIYLKYKQDKKAFSLTSTPS